MLFAGLTIRYRRFKAHHEHTYPISFFLIGVGKFTLEMALLCFVFLNLILFVMKVSSGEKPGLLADAARPDSQQVVSVSDTVVVPVKQVVQVHPAEIPDVISAASPSAFGRASEPNDVSITVAPADQLASSENTLQKIVIARSKEGSGEGQIAAIYDQEWILARPAEYFVIQLASSPRLDKLVDFSAELEGSKMISIYPFKVLASDELLYGISVGEFPTLQHAVDAVDGFPKTARRYSPWVRKLSDVQKDINSVLNQ